MSRSIPAERPLHDHAVVLVDFEGLCLGDTITVFYFAGVLALQLIYALIDSITQEIFAWGGKWSAVLSLSK